ncbi:MAG: hypothetical protein Athens041674_236 [Parcubacteria group bacterium Athens0416_74]|nr:MAG: hypothetical protein Athens041674_236 [Parcubacteria group bacterium Athens0416_74]
MRRRYILLALILAAGALFIAQAVGIALVEQREANWYFTPAHIIGGVCAALAYMYVVEGLALRPVLLHCLAAVLIVGVSWEIYEYATIPALQSLDTASDIVADLLGGYVTFKVVYRA